MEHYDVLIVGGGPAGLMAAVAAAENGARVCLLDKGDRLGRKLAISGGGRCNVTNAMPIGELIRHIPGNGRFLYGALTRFGNHEIIRFFEGLGIKLKEEDHGRVFPVSDSARSVVNALLRKIAELGVTIKTHSPVQKLIFAKRAIGAKLASAETITAGAVIVATGGKSVPSTGSTGDGYPWAKAAGHTITELYPTEVPLTSSEPFIREKRLQGLALRDAAVSLIDPNGKIVQTHRWDLLFTHFGLSGPAVLRLSQFVVKTFKKFNATKLIVCIDTFPDISEEDVYHRLLRLAALKPDRALKHAWKTLVPQRYLLLLCESAGLSSDIDSHSLKKESARQLARLLKRFPVHVDGTLTLEKAFITGGGVSLKEIDPKTMASKRMPGLYFCGEILDIHGYTGGYNITAAFSTGHAAGVAAARQDRKQS